MLDINRYGSAKDMSKTIRLSKEFDDWVSDHVFRDNGYNNFNAFARDAIAEKITGTNRTRIEPVADVTLTLQRILGILLRINTRAKKLPQGRTRKLMILAEKVLKEAQRVIKAAHDA